MPDVTGANLDDSTRRAPREEPRGREAAASAKAERSASLQEEPQPALGPADDEDRMSDWLREAIWRRELLLVDARERLRVLEGELAAIEGSLSWRATAPLRSWSARHVRAATLLRQSAKVAYWALTLQLSSRLRARRRGLRIVQRIEASQREQTYERWIETHDTLTPGDLQDMRSMVAAFEHKPLVSVLMPVFDPPERFLRQAIDSVRAQVYENWELCVADDASSATHVRGVLDEYARRDSRIRVTYRAENGGISEASNSALALARGELVGLLDHDDLLRPHALLLAVQAFDADPDVGYVYSDEDKIDESGRRFGYWFKPDWNPALLLSQNYLCHFSVFKASLLRRVGGFRSEYDGSQDWDLALRITEAMEPKAIVHVPHVLYHWRAIPGSAAAEASAKPFAVEAGKRAAEDHLRRIGRPGYVIPAGRRTQRVSYLLPSPRPFVSVIVPTTGRPDLVEPCLEGVLRRTAYERLEVVLAVSADAYRDPDTRRCLERATGDARVRVVELPSGPFNFAQTVNRAASDARGDLLLLLNDDTEIIDGAWLDAMVGHALAEDVGAVGALLLYPDGTIQHAGMLVGARGVAEHLYNGRTLGIAGYMGRAALPQDVSVVAGTCMLVKRDAFVELGGFDEAFPVCYNDIDFCLRLRRRGLRVLFVPDAVLHHQETASFRTHQEGREDQHLSDVARMRARWGAVLEDDPMHNPNLALDASDPSQLAFPPRVGYPWRRRSAEKAQLSANRVAASSSSAPPVYV